MIISLMYWRDYILEQHKY